MSGGACCLVRGSLRDGNVGDREAEVVLRGGGVGGREAVVDVWGIAERMLLSTSSCWRFGEELFL